MPLYHIESDIFKNRLWGFFSTGRHAGQAFMTAYLFFFPYLIKKTFQPLRNGFVQLILLNKEIWLSTCLFIIL